MAAIIGNSTALNAVVSSSTAMAAIAASSTALSAIAASTTALDAIYAKKKRMSGASASLSGKFIILQISNDNAFDTSQYGYATLSDGSKPNWDSYKGKYAYFKLLSTGARLQLMPSRPTKQPGPPSRERLAQSWARPWQSFLASTRTAMPT